MKKINKKIYSRISAVIVLGIFLAIAIPAQTGAAQIATQPLVNKEEIIGPFESQHSYQIDIFNIDDTANLYVNGNLVKTVTAGQDTGFIDISNFLKQNTDNIIQVALFNVKFGWTYSIVVERDHSDIIYQDQCGIYTVQGCMNNDQTQGEVYLNDMILTKQLPLFSFVRGSDNALWYRTFDGGIWSSWVSLGGVLNSDPDSAKDSNGNVFVFVRGTDNALWFREYQGQTNTWFNWVSLGGVVSSGPGAS